MTMKFIRLTARHNNRNGSERRPKIQLDLKIDVETKTILGKWSIYGVFGSNSDSGYGIHPFILLEDGRIDYGTEWEEERFGYTNLRSKVIEPETYFEFHDSDNEEYSYQIKTVAALGEGLH